jgi:uncharacterized membrane protein
MSEECVVAVYDEAADAQQAVHILDRGGFPMQQVSLVTVGLKDRPEVMEDLEMGDDSIADAAVGAGLGAIAGVLAGTAAAMVAGLGLIFLMGPIGGGLVGAMTGAFLGSLSGWGVHEKRIRHYEKLVKAGKALVIAHGNPLQLNEADRMLKETATEELHIYAKTDSEAPEVRQD